MPAVGLWWPSAFEVELAQINRISGFTCAEYFLFYFLFCLLFCLFVSGAAEVTQKTVIVLLLLLFSLARKKEFDKCELMNDYPSQHAVLFRQLVLQM